MISISYEIVAFYSAQVLGVMPEKTVVFTNYGSCTLMLRCILRIVRKYTLARRFIERALGQAPVFRPLTSP